MTGPAATPPRVDAEAVRNRLLRRLDWRFLLPVPDPGVAVCFGDGELESAVREIAGRVVDRAAVGAGECDLAVAVDPDADTLQAAYRALKAGGYLGVEWSGLPGSTPGGVRRMLAAAGFQTIGLLAPHPRPGRGTANHWVPLDAPGAALFVSGLRRRPTRRSRRIRRALVEAAWRKVPHLRVALPFRAIARRVGDGNPEALADAIVRGWTAPELGPRPERVALALLTGGRRSVNKVVALVFAGSESRPRMAVKMARVAESIEGLEREAATLLTLQDRDPPLRGIPRVLYHELGGGAPRVGESIVEGRRLEEVLAGDTLASLARRVTRWQIGLAGDPPAWRPDELRQSIVEPAVESFRAVFGAVADPGMLRDAAAELEALGPLPRVCEQRDFSPWNVLVGRDGGVSVLDWESSTLEGVPATDLIYFLAYAAVVLRGAFATGDYASAYRAFRDPGTAIGSVSAECVAEYAGALKLDDTQVRGLRILTWMLHARSAYRLLAAESGGSAPAQDRLRSSEFFQFWDAEMRESAKAF